MGNVVEFPQPRAAMTVEDHIRGLGDRLTEEMSTAQYFAKAMIACATENLSPQHFLREALDYVDRQVPIARFKNGIPVE